MRKLKYVLITIIIFFTDIYLKNRIEKWAAVQGGDTFKRKYITISKHHNRGLPMNLAENHQEKIAKLSLFTTIFLTILFIHALKKENKPLIKTALALQLGGAYSNTYDRLKRKYVVDYFSFNLPGKPGQIILNIGDMAIFAGSFLSLVDAVVNTISSKLATKLPISN